jgi:hypothetical protein
LKLREMKEVGKTNGFVKTKERKQAWTIFFAFLQIGLPGVKGLKIDLKMFTDLKIHFSSF